MKPYGNMNGYCNLEFLSILIESGEIRLLLTVFIWIKCVSQMFIAIRTMLTLGIVMFYSYYYFSFEMSFSKILESFSSLP